MEERKSAAVPEGVADGSQAAAAAAGEESTPATEFITVESARASGTCHELQSDFQHIKFLYVEESKSLFAMAVDGQGVLEINKQLFGHGAGDWLRPPQSTRLIAQEEASLHIFQLESDMELVALEIPGSSEESEATTVQTIMQDAIVAGLVDLKWWQHTVKLGGLCSTCFYAHHLTCARHAQFVVD